MVSKVSIDLTVDKTLRKQFCYFVLQKSALFVKFLAYKCVSIQNST